MILSFTGDGEPPTPTQKNTVQGFWTQFVEFSFEDCLVRPDVRLRLPRACVRTRVIREARLTELLRHPEMLHPCSAILPLVEEVLFGSEPFANAYPELLPPCAIALENFTEYNYERFFTEYKQEESSTECNQEPNLSLKVKKQILAISNKEKGLA